ncbi:MAG: FxsA family protein [Granulosicoccus sp.]
MPWFLLLFIVMPIVEIAVLLRVGDALGWLPTLAIVIITAVLGTSMLRQQGIATLARARKRMGAGEMPAQQLLEGVLLLIGGVLLLTPGFVTDAFGFACLIPVSRRWLAAHLASRAKIFGSSTIIGGGRMPGVGRKSDGHGSFGEASDGSAGPFGAVTGEEPRYDNERRKGPAAAAKPPSSGQNRGNIIEGDYHRTD